MPVNAEDRRNNRQPGAANDLVAHNVHFSQNTMEVLRLHSALYRSGGISGLTRTVMEWFLARTINFDDPTYRDVEPVAIPPERYPGQHRKLGLL